MKIYCDGALRLSFTDGSGHAIVSGGELRFFKDDGSENGSGSVCRIRLHAGALGPAEVAALDRGPAVLPVVISQPQSRAVAMGVPAAKRRQHVAWGASPR